MAPETTTAAVSQGGFMTTLAERVNSTEAFIIIVMMLIGFGLWKIFGEFKQLVHNREVTTESRNKERENLQSQINDLKNNDTKQEGMLLSHFQRHEDLDKKLDDIEKMKEAIYEIKGSMKILLERSSGNPKIPK